MVSIFSMPDGSEISSKWVKCSTFHLLISHKTCPSISAPTLPGSQAWTRRPLVSLVPSGGTHAGVPPSYLPLQSGPEMQSEGWQAAGLGAPGREVSFPIHFAVHLPSGTSQAFPLYINQSRPERGVQSKAWPLPAFSKAHRPPAAHPPGTGAAVQSVASEVIAMHRRASGLAAQPWQPEVIAWLIVWEDASRLYDSMLQSL